MPSSAPDAPRRGREGADGTDAAVEGGIRVRRVVLAGLALLLVALQVRLWTGTGSLAEISELQARVDAQHAENRRLTEHNTLLEAEVRSLKTDPEAVEARARGELGMIRDGETFYMVLPEARRGTDASP